MLSAGFGFCGLFAAACGLLGCYCCLVWDCWLVIFAAVELGFALVCVILFDLLFSVVYSCVLFIAGGFGSGVAVCGSVGGGCCCCFDGWHLVLVECGVSCLRSVCLGGFDVVYLLWLVVWLGFGFACLRCVMLLGCDCCFLCLLIAWRLICLIVL